jgi:hypothetical protein
MKSVAIAAVAVLVVGQTGPAAAQAELQPPSAFASIGDRGTRSRAIFTEAAKVITSPRCMNCHPANDHPTQGNDRHLHSPSATRGAGFCQTCHTDSNYTLSERATYQSIPGHARWGLAPIEMAWQGKTIGEICRQLKDPNRNGGRSLALLQEHAAKDDLVAWGWQPGAGRDPAPGSQQIFGELFQAWIETGAECPG